jgi:hypothetical protein
MPFFMQNPMKYQQYRSNTSPDNIKLELSPANQGRVYSFNVAMAAVK